MQLLLLPCENGEDVLPSARTELFLDVCSLKDETFTLGIAVSL